MPIYAICPFFIYEKAKQIKCEAYLFNFPNHQHKRKLTKKFCESFNYEKCKHAQILLKKYEKGGA